MAELVPRDSFNVIQGCANSGPGRLRIPEVTWMDGLGFSLCAAPLDIVGSCISKWHGQNCSRRTEVQYIQDWREAEGFSEQENCTWLILSRYLVNIQTDYIGGSLL